MKLDIKITWCTLSLFAIILLVIDQISKIVIKLSMKIGETIYVFGKWFQIKFIENPGAAYGFEISDGEWGKLALSIIRIFAILGLVYYITKLSKDKAPKGVIIGFVLIFAGAVGNLLDSMFYGLIFSESTMWNVAECVSIGDGYSSFLQGDVVDMLYFPIINGYYPEWFPFWGGDRFIFFSPIFNLADSYISIGFLYLLIFKRAYFNQKTESN